MKASALNEFSDIGFVFIDLKTKYNELDKDLQRDVDWLEKAVKRVCASRKKIENDIEELFPKLFSLRIKALNRVAEEGENLHSVLNEMVPVMNQLGGDQRIRSIISNVSRAINYNKKLVEFLELTGQLSKEKIKATKNLDYQSYFVVLQYMPSQLKRLMSGLTITSLGIEFLSVAAILIHEKLVPVSGTKLLQLSSFSKNTVDEYIVHTDMLIRMAQYDNFSSERQEWAAFGMLNLSGAYSADEPDISHLELKERNPGYNPN
jgi:hypothetical protein